MNKKEQVHLNASNEERAQENQARFFKALEEAKVPIVNCDGGTSGDRFYCRTLRLGRPDPEAEEPWIPKGSELGEPFETEEDQTGSKEK